MILDAGALIAVSRNDRAMIARLVAAEAEGDELQTHAMVVAQVWRDQRGRQAPLARLLRGVEIVSIDDDLGRRSGELLGKARTSDPIDAAVVLIASDGDVIVTSDPDDILHLARSARRKIVAVRC
ncbi:MAG: type II toxin-antitoxin system VapC family toxin [Deltaproteobacteria bacterium]|nr:MAG: type II toxin-antitoxin system VapC family toxin [Deltaproteobacteria bacterium]TMQ22634.1 MAG: type II toxin-antitoxin system VapC family toxin [Deltaproteobacteria bacterium]